MKRKRESERKAAKKDVCIKEFRIPPRSPDLNVLEYAIWSAIVRDMRKQEAAFPNSKKESREEYLQRLQVVLPKTFIEASVRDMKRRCQRLREEG